MVSLRSVAYSRNYRLRPELEESAPDQKLPRQLYSRKLSGYGLVFLALFGGNSPDVVADDTFVVDEP